MLCWFRTTEKWIAICQLWRNIISKFTITWSSISDHKLPPSKGIGELLRNYKKGDFTHYLHVDRIYTTVQSYEGGDVIVIILRNNSALWMILSSNENRYLNHN